MTSWCEPNLPTGQTRGTISNAPANPPPNIYFRRKIELRRSELRSQGGQKCTKSHLTPGFFFFSCAETPLAVCFKTPSPASARGELGVIYHPELGWSLLMERRRSEAGLEVAGLSWQRDRRQGVIVFLTVTCQRSHFFCSWGLVRQERVRADQGPAPRRSSV